MPAIMVQGTGSGVGKSTLVAAFCRIFRRDGRRVAPFKAQNMANNAFVCRDGGEIGRAQAVQALACGIEPAVDMNPVLLKPSTDTGAQVVVMGRPVRTLSAREYEAFKPSLLPLLRGCLERLLSRYEIVVIEGAGSPAEVNLREGDIVNMRTAEIADAPVLLAGNIDTGGVFAQFVGTMELLLEEERARVRGLIVNKFRGDIEILRPGLEFLERRTGRPVLGVVPHFRGIRIAEEDAVPPREVGSAPDGKIRIDVVLLSRMANFTDFDALESEPDVRLRYVEAPDGTLPDALVLPGTKSTIADLRRLKAAGFADLAGRCLERGGTVVGICGGFQMLGARVLDPEHVESAADSEPGLGLLPMTTVFEPEKVAAQAKGVHLESGAEVEGYEIHMGRAAGGPPPRPVLRISERGGAAVSDFDGAEDRGGRVWGTYLHGLFDGPAFRRHFVNRLRAARGWPPRAASSGWSPDAELDALAALVRSNVDIDRVYRILRKEA